MRQLYKLFLFLFLFAGAVRVNAQANNWVKKNGFDGTKRERGIGLCIGSRGYVGFGHDSGTVTLNDWWEYDPGTDTWTQKASCPGSGRRDAIGFVLNNKAYVGTGDNSNNAQFGNPLSDLWQYDPATNTWTVRAQYPGAFGSGVYYATGFSANGKGYVCGGKVGASNYVAELWEYNSSTNSWLQKASFPGGPRYGLSSFSVNGKGYVGLGVDYNILRYDIWCYDPTNNQWSQRANFPSSPRYSAATFTLGPDGFVVTGTDGGYKMDLWEYSSTYNIWVQRADFLGGPRRSAVAFSIGNRGYTGTGLSVLGSKRDIYEYTPLAPLGLADLDKVNFSISVFPNPMITSSTIEIRTQQSLKDATVLLYDVSGKLVRTLELNGSSISFEREGLDAGIYFIGLSSENRTVATTKLIIQ